MLIVKDHHYERNDHHVQDRQEDPRLRLHQPRARDPHHQHVHHRSSPHHQHVYHRSSPRRVSALEERDLPRGQAADEDHVQRQVQRLIRHQEVRRHDHDSTAPDRAVVFKRRLLYLLQGLSFSQLLHGL